jgi:hypothetical protein
MLRALSRLSKSENKFLSFLDFFKDRNMKKKMAQSCGRAAPPQPKNPIRHAASPPHSTGQDPRRASSNAPSPQPHASAELLLESSEFRGWTRPRLSSRSPRPSPPHAPAGPFPPASSSAAAFPRPPCYAVVRTSSPPPPRRGASPSRATSSSYPSRALRSAARGPAARRCLGGGSRACRLRRRSRRAGLPVAVAVRETVMAAGATARTGGSGRELHRGRGWWRKLQGRKPTPSSLTSGYVYYLYELINYHF